MRMGLFWATVLIASPALAAEQVFNFGDMTPDLPPPGFHSVVAGQGKPGEWKVILDDVPPVLEPLSGKAPAVARRAVLAQSARGAAENRFPMLIFEGESYGDFQFTSRFKIVGGALEQTMGLVFRFQNESNFFAVGISALAKTFRCFKVVNGEWKPPLGPELEIARGTWHEMTVLCEGTRLVCSLDGREAIKLIDPTATPTGKIGFWTKADTIGYFTDAKITYQSRVVLAQKLVNDALKKYPRLIDLKVYAIPADGKVPVVIASMGPKDLGLSGGSTEQEVITKGKLLFDKDQKGSHVIAPLRDRNGEPIAAVRVVLKTFPGQTQDNARIRAQPVIQKMQAGVISQADLLQ